jgi:hypothetical protein
VSQNYPPLPASARNSYLCSFPLPLTVIRYREMFLKCTTQQCSGASSQRKCKVHSDAVNVHNHKTSVGNINCIVLRKNKWVEEGRSENGINYGTRNFLTSEVT